MTKRQLLKRLKARGIGWRTRHRMVCIAERESGTYKPSTAWWSTVAKLTRR